MKTWLVLCLFLCGCTSKPAQPPMLMPEKTAFPHSQVEEEPAVIPCPIGEDDEMSRKLFAQMISNPKLKLVGRIEVSGNTVKLSHFTCK
jgi:hypothetical protein